MIQESKEERRKKLFIFASITLILLSIAAFYFESYDPYNVPIGLRICLAIYWLYSLISIIVSKIGSDEWVTKIYFNINR